MYYYIYDSFLNSGKYQKTLEKIEVRLTDLGIQGKIRRLNILHHQKEVIEESIRRGAKTIVLVGNDRSIMQAADVLARHDVAIGIIPIGTVEENRIARTLGIPLAVLACDVLSRRTIVRVDAGKADLHYFLTEASVTATTFECVGGRKGFRIHPLAQKTHLAITNLALVPLTNEKIPPSNPRDGILELTIRDATRSFRETLGFEEKTKRIPSIFPIEEITIREPADTPLTLDGCRSVKLPVTITIAPQRFRMIVGRERSF